MCADELSTSLIAGCCSQPGRPSQPTPRWWWVDVGARAIRWRQVQTRPCLVLKPTYPVLILSSIDMWKVESSPVAVVGQAPPQQASDVNLMRRDATRSTAAAAPVK